jgi:hypothetical protein
MAGRVTPVVLLVLLLAATAWMYRYQLSAAGAGGQVAVFVLDRWTGTVWGCDARRCFHMFPGPEATASGK